MDLNEISISQVAIGALLKAHREHMNLQQRDIAQALRYRNINYISILESGRSNIPLAKIKELAEAYRIDAIIIPIITKYLNPDVWELQMSIIEKCPELFGNLNRETIESEIDKRYFELLREYSLGEYVKMYRRK